MIGRKPQSVQFIEGGLPGAIDGKQHGGLCADPAYELLLGLQLHRLESQIARLEVEGGPHRLHDQPEPEQPGGGPSRSICRASQLPPRREQQRSHRNEDRQKHTGRDIAAEAEERGEEHVGQARSDHQQSQAASGTTPSTQEEEHDSGHRPVGPDEIQALVDAAAEELEGGGFGAEQEERSADEDNGSRYSGRQPGCGESQRSRDPKEAQQLREDDTRGGEEPFRNRCEVDHGAALHPRRPLCGGGGPHHPAPLRLGQEEHEQGSAHASQKACWGRIEVPVDAKSLEGSDRQQDKQQHRHGVLEQQGCDGSHQGCRRNRGGRRRTRSSPQQAEVHGQEQDGPNQVELTRMPHVEEDRWDAKDEEQGDP